MSTDARYCFACEQASHTTDLEQIDGCDGPIKVCPYCGHAELEDAYQCEDCQGYFADSLFEPGTHLCWTCAEIANDPGARQGHP